MKSLKCLNKESIELLNNNKLLKPLIHAEYIKNILKEVIIEKELSNEITDKFLAKYDLNDPQKYKEWLEKNNLTNLEVRNLALADIRLKRYCMENFEHQIESRFLERKDHLDMFVYSMIRVKEYFKANELYLRIIEKEEDIGDLASKFSEGPEKKSRGVVGPLSLEAAHPILAKQLKDCKPGEIKSPIQIEKFHIVCRLESHDPAKLDQAMREKMSIELFDKWIEKPIEEINNELLSNLKTNRNTEAGS